jgi:hypothetical protein
MLSQRKLIQGPAECALTVVRAAGVAIAGLVISGVGSSFMLTLFLTVS